MLGKRKQQDPLYGIDIVCRCVVICDFVSLRDKLLEQVGLEHFNAVSRCARARAALNEIAEDDWRRQAESEIEDKQ